MAERMVCIDVNGLTLTPRYDPEVVRQAMKYKPQKGEVLVASYPKCGTTWIMMIVLLLLRKGKPISTAKEWFGCSPYLDTNLPEEIERRPKPRCIQTHFPFNRMTYSPDAKYIYITRHPADCLVSYYHFVQFLPIQEFSPNTFDQVFDHFLRGEVLYGDYFDHLLSWYEQRTLPNVLFLTYESVKRNPRDAILKIANFLDDSLFDELMADDEAMLNKVLQYSSIESMKTSINCFYEEGMTTPPPEGGVNKLFTMMEEAKNRGFNSSGEFVRKGKIGEGKITLSKEQIEKLNARIVEKTAQSDVMDLWKDV